MVTNIQSERPYFRVQAFRLTATPQFVSTTGMHPSTSVVVEYMGFCNHDPAFASHPVTVQDGNGMFLAYLKSIGPNEPFDIVIPESGIEFTNGVKVFTDAGGAGLVDCWIRCRRVQ